MKRLTVLATIALVGLLSMIATAGQQRQGGAGRQGGAPLGGTPSADAIMVEQLRDNLFVLRGGGNTAAFITADGVVLVDTKLTGWGQPLLEKVRTLTNRPVTTLINTHTHFDHVNGNVEFPATVEVIAHQNTRRYMQEQNPVFGLTGIEVDNPFARSGGRGMPTRTFQDTLSIGTGDDRIDLYFHGRAHTGGDAFVVFRAARVMHAGDVFPGKRPPLMDRNNGGSGVRYPDTVAKAAQTPNVDQVITGHSTMMTLAELREFGEFNQAFVDAVQQAKRAGQTIDQFIASWKVPARFSGYAQPQPEELRSNTQVVWDETN
jgi:glyoxylase-like metal-dependent hydrolase (beta-lactamase superfamily II)